MTHASKSIDQETAQDRQNRERNFFQLQKNKVLHDFTSESQMTYSLSFVALSAETTQDLDLHHEILAPRPGLEPGTQ